MLMKDTGHYCGLCVNQCDRKCLMNGSENIFTVKVIYAVKYYYQKKGDY